jgi:hypothetical protein
MPSCAPTSSSLRHFPQRHLRLASPSRCTRGAEQHCYLPLICAIRPTSSLLLFPRLTPGFFAVAYKSFLQLKPAEFRQVTRYRLGIADHNEEQVGPVCWKSRRSQDPQDASFYGDHSTQCHGGGSLHRRHDRLKVVLYAALRSSGYSPQLEPPHLLCETSTRVPYIV